MRKQTKTSLTEISFREVRQGTADAPSEVRRTADERLLDILGADPSKTQGELAQTARTAPTPEESPSESAPRRAVSRPGLRFRPVESDDPPPQSAAEEELPSWARAAYWVAIAASLVWAGCMLAFASGYQNAFGAFEYRPYPALAFLGLCLLPPVFLLLSAYAVRQGAWLSMETGRARALADDLAIPAALAADKAAGASHYAQGEVDRAAAAAAAAERQLLDLRRTLAEQSERLIQATDEAERRAQELTRSLSREREEMTGLARTLDASVQSVAESIASQSRLVADASDLAAAQIQEAEAGLAARAADLAATAGAVADVAELAGERLALEGERLAAAGQSLSEDTRGAQERLAQEHERLRALGESLRSDQDDAAAKVEAQRAALTAAGEEARESVDALTEASVRGAESLRGLIADVGAQMGQLADAAEADHAAITQSARDSLKLFSGVVAEERAALEAEAQAALAAVAAAAAEARRTAAEEAQNARLQVAEERAALEGEAQETLAALAAAAADSRRTAAEQAERARIQVEQLGESAFLASQRADQAFDARLGAARRMIEESAGLVDSAGQKSAERIEAGLGGARQTLQELEALLHAIDSKVANLPDEARVRAETVRQAVETGMEALTAAARRAAEETQAIDAAFQGRIKQNYQILSDALKLMGRSEARSEPVRPPMATPAAPAPAPAAPAATPLPLPSSAAPIVPSGSAPGPSAAGSSAPNLSASGLARPATASEEPIRLGAAAQPAPPEGEALGLRPRLKLTLDPGPEIRIDRPPPPAPAPAALAPRTGAEWTWKDLLSSIDEPPMDDEVLAERLISEIEALGLDVASVLPLGRIDEIAAALQRGDSSQLREAVRAMAPSAVRRLSRRVLTDRVLRSHADRYVQRYEDLLADSAKRDRDGFLTATLLGSDPGRAFLLFKAAVGELH